MPAQPPAKQNPALQGLAAAASPDAQIAQRQKVNQAMSGGVVTPESLKYPTNAPESPFHSPSAGGVFFNNPNDGAGRAELEGLVNVMTQSGIKGQRLTDIELPEPFEELMKRSNALLGQR